MTWVSHKLITGSIIFAITGNPIASLFAAAGSILPDALEGFPPESDNSKWRRNHRQLTHWFIPYLIVAILLFAFAYTHGVKSLGTASALKLAHFAVPSGLEFAVIAYVFAFISLGACLHCLPEDALCGTVPGFNPAERIGFRLFYVGSPKEFAITIPISLALILTRYKIGMI